MARHFISDLKNAKQVWDAGRDQEAACGGRDISRFHPGTKRFFESFLFFRLLNLKFKDLLVDAKIDFFGSAAADCQSFKHRKNNVATCFRLAGVC